MRADPVDQGHDVERLLHGAGDAGTGDFGRGDGVAAEDEDGHVAGACLAHRRDDLVPRHSRHFHVEKDQIEVTLARQFDSFEPGARDARGESELPEDALHQRQNREVVIDDENDRLGLHLSSTVYYDIDLEAAWLSDTIVKSPSSMSWVPSWWVRRARTPPARRGWAGSRTRSWMTTPPASNSICIRRSPPPLPDTSRLSPSSGVRSVGTSTSP